MRLYFDFFLYGDIFDLHSFISNFPIKRVYASLKPALPGSADESKETHCEKTNGRGLGH